MPQFAPGEEKTAVVTMTNPTTAPFDYYMVLYMGVNMVAMGDAEFSLEAGESKDISMPVVMPPDPGVYPVYIDVWSGETLLGHYQATENVEIVSLGGALGTFSTLIYPAARPRSRAAAGTTLYLMA